ncbi:hypothetical protein ASPWEDRAFT_118398 [Aspergillus wentii DTO 134E9]|uniref:Carrier domain-containing protein n=1 Tax=Aspergillus wentii DTO 134E9 TaxID=1073089 RepID=A0A1L9R7G7_ASPWE|nr:uncharacterized protein ASPWEDRAFT_118398 [Aspergillus wentii DTO 134E9]OJJ30813.1 hypothetical protein ASPWEDRAFT_118398 [Aspergillus wentii DTO 134E9]
MEQILCNNANAYPDTTAIVDHGRSYTYKDLMAAALALATDLHKQDMKPEEPVCVFLGPGAGQIVSQVAIIRAGGTCVPVDPSMPDARLHEMLADVETRLVLTTEDLASRVSNFNVILVDNVTREDIKHATGDGVHALAARPDSHRSHLLFTSGSTGKPKAVQIPARAIIHLATTSPIQLTNGDQVAEFNNSGFDLSLFEIWVPLLSGATIICIPKEVVTDPFAVGDFFTSNKVTAALIPTSLFILLATTSPCCFRALRHLVTAGERASSKAIRQVLESDSPPQNLWNAYGPTECTCYSTVARVTLAEAQTDSVNIGHPFGETKVYILTEDLKPVQDTETQGEICIAGPGVCLGYLNDPKANTNKIVEFSPEDMDPVLLCRTGDMGRWREVGKSMDYIGRIDDQIKLQGYRVELGDIEQTLEGHENVKQAVVLHAKEQGDRLVAVVVLQDSADSESTCLNRMRHWISDRLPHYMVPNEIKCIDKLPLNSRGKVDRNNLKGMVLNGPKQGRRETAPDANEAQTIFQSILNEILGIPDIEPDQSITELGLSSLGAARLLGRIKEEFGKPVSMVQLYQDPTIKGLAHFLDLDIEWNYGPSEILQLEADSKICDDLQANRTSQAVPDWMKEGRVFLTGATGFLGANLMSRLVQMENIKQVACLARSQGTSTAMERIESSLRKYRLWNDTVAEAIKKKAIVLDGDITQEQLGLEGADFQWLIDWTPAIIHAAAKVNWCAPYSAHFAPNVTGTRNVLSVALQGRCKSFHYVSSIDVWTVTGLILGTDRVSEDGPLKVHLASLPFDTGYAQSQWVVDEMVQRVRDRTGIPVTIYRPGFVVGDSKTAAGNPDDFFSRMVVGSIQLGYWPQLPEQNMEYVTSDYVCDGLLHIAANPDNLGKCFSLTAGDRALSTYMDTLGKFINQAGFPVHQIPFKDWVQKLQQWPGLGKSPLLSLMPLLTEPVLRGYTRLETSKFSPVYECTNTRKALKDSPGIHHIELTPELVRRFIQFWVEEGYHVV